MAGYFGVGLVSPKCNANVGSALRAAGVYGGSWMAATGARYAPGATDTMKHYRSLPFFRPASLFDLMPYDCIPVAVDLIEDAEPLNEYQHPNRAYYIFGPEDGTLGRATTDKCRDTIYIPTNGCMNLAATVNVVLYDRMAKRLNKRG